MVEYLMHCSLTMCQQNFMPSEAFKNQLRAMCLGGIIYLTQPLRLFQHVVILNLWERCSLQVATPPPSLWDIFHKSVSEFFRLSLSSVTQKVLIFISWLLQHCSNITTMTPRLQTGPALGYDSDNINDIIRQQQDEVENDKQIDYYAIATSI